MLKQRLITAFILGTLVIWGIFALPSLWFAAIFGAFACVGAWEWAGLIKISRVTGRLFYVSGIAIIFVLLTPWMLDASNILYLTGAGVIWWLFATVMVFRYRGGDDFQPGIIDVLNGIFLLLPCWAGIVWLQAQEYGPQLVLFMMMCIWAADSGAYFAGRRFGKRKLAPHVSPGKSWEGVFGGFIFAVLFAILSSLFWFEWQGEFAAGFILLAVVTVIISVVGDLAESVFKRRVGVKDSGTILPGHGGVLDRIDSLTAAAPVFATGYWLLENVL